MFEGFQADLEVSFGLRNGILAPILPKVGLRFLSELPITYLVKRPRAKRPWCLGQLSYELFREAHHVSPTSLGERQEYACIHAFHPISRNTAIHAQGRVYPTRNA